MRMKNNFRSLVDGAMWFSFGFTRRGPLRQNCVENREGAAVRKRFGVKYGHPRPFGRGTRSRKPHRASPGSGFSVSRKGEEFNFEV